MSKESRLSAREQRRRRRPFVPLLLLAYLRLACERSRLKMDGWMTTGAAAWLAGRLLGVDLFQNLEARGVLLVDSG